MRVAVLGGIRANLPALEAVLGEVGRHRVSAIWNVGNFLGYGPYPAETLALLRDRGVMSVLGPDELLLLKLSQMKDSAHRVVQPDFLPLRHAHATLTQEHLAYVRGIPRQLELHLGGRRVVVVHGFSPFSQRGEAALERLRVLADESHAEVVVWGQGMVPSLDREDDVVLLNPGAVGQTHDGDPKATYAILTLTPRQVRAQFYRVAYDTARLAAAFAQRGIAAELWGVLVEGRPLQTEPPVGSEAGGEDDPRLRAVLAFAQSCDFEAEHTHQVTRLALKLFDELAPYHGLDATDRFLLHCACLLHDIGWVEGQHAHHKTALRLILTSPTLPFDERERLLVGSIARYHRKALPGPGHEHYAVLSKEDKRRVDILAGILRVADGLDRTHRSLVEDFTCTVTDKKITLRCRVRWPAEMERQTALDKGQLLERALGRHLAIRWHLA